MARNKVTEPVKEISIFDDIISDINDCCRTVQERESDSVGFWSCCYGVFDHEKDCPAKKAIKNVKELKEKYEGKDS